MEVSKEIQDWLIYHEPTVYTVFVAAMIMAEQQTEDNKLEEAKN